MTLTAGHPYTPIPDAFTAAGGTTIAAELPLYEVHLQAENKSRATVSLWTGAARQLSVRPLISDHWCLGCIASGGAKD